MSDSDAPLEAEGAITRADDGTFGDQNQEIDGNGGAIFDDFTENGDEVIVPDLIDETLADGEVPSWDNLADVVSQITKERDDYLDALQRTKADFDNFRRRTARLEAEASERRVVALLERLIPSLDDLASLLAHKVGAPDEELVTKTIRPIFSALANEGLVVIEEVGAEFNPEIHQAVAHEDGDGPAKVAEIFRSGYLWKGKTIRPAMVKVVG